MRKWDDGVPAGVLEVDRNTIIVRQEKLDSSQVARITIYSDSRGGLGKHYIGKIQYSVELHSYLNPIANVF